MNFKKLPVLAGLLGGVAFSQAKPFDPLSWSKSELSAELTRQTNKISDKKPKRKIAKMSQVVCDVPSKGLSLIADLQSSASKQSKGALLRKVVNQIGQMQLDASLCLMSSLTSLASKHTTSGKYEPLHLLQYLRQIDHPIYRNEAVKVMHAMRFLQIGDYPETLRILWQLKDVNLYYVDSYNQVQKIFAKKQRGQGSVALRQNL